MSIRISKRLQLEARFEMQQRRFSPITRNMVSSFVWKMCETEIFFLIVHDASFLPCCKCRLNRTPHDVLVAAKPLRLSRAKPQGGPHWHWHWHWHWFGGRERLRGWKTWGFSIVHQVCYQIIGLWARFFRSSDIYCTLWVKICGSEIMDWKVLADLSCSRESERVNIS